MVSRLAKAHGVQGSLMLAILQCENGLHDPERKTSVWDGIHYTASGLFMFTDPTYRSTRRAMGEPDDQLLLKHNAYENARTAAWKIANGGLSAWEASRWCWEEKM